MTAEKLPWKDLEEEVRNVPLLEQRDGETIYPYAEATIKLRKFAFHEVRPSSLYVLSANLALQRSLFIELGKLGIDPLNLKGRVVLHDTTGGAISMIPPIVEETPEDGKYILDGLHRTYLGKAMGRTVFWGIHITGIREDCPAAARPNGWEDIKIWDSVPADIKQKRRYRQADYLKLRRDFSAINGSKPRFAG